MQQGGRASPADLPAGRRKSGLYLNPSKQQFRLTCQASQGLEALLYLFATVCISLRAAWLILGVCVSQNILNKSGELKTNRIRGSEASVWVETTSATFGGMIFFGLTGGRARFCSCSSRPCHCPSPTLALPLAAPRFSLAQFPFAHLPSLFSPFTQGLFFTS